MKYRIVDFTGEFDCEEIKNYGSYHHPKFKIKAAANLLIALTPVFAPSILILTPSDNLVCLRIKHSFIIMDKEQFETNYCEEKRLGFDEVTVINPISNSFNTVLSLVHSLSIYGDIHTTLVKKTEFV
jgi:hypothetical protein